MDALAIQAALGEAERLVHQQHSFGIPVDVTRIARNLGVAEIGPALISSDGYIGRRADGRLVIRYNDANPRQRKRFTIAHEIGHLILAQQLGEDLGRRHRSGMPNADEEFVVNRIASELLMPGLMFRQDLAELAYRGVRSPWKAVGILKERYDVAESAAVLRILELPQVLGVLFRINLKGQETLYPFDGSESVSFRLIEPIAATAQRVWAEYQRGTTYCTVQVEHEGAIRDIQCQGLMRALRSARGESTQYWMLGWRFVD